MSGEDVKDELKQRLARAMMAMQKMQARIDVLERSRTEPIAIIGMGCRFPGGVDTPEAYWELLAAGRDAIRREPSARRFGPEPSTPRWAGYLEDVSGFDAAFFGISPREALSLDPRQRLLLEVAWEALEHAGVDAERLVDSSTGVFVGLTGDDYARLLPAEPENIDAYFGTGNGHCFPPGRVSYTLGLRGPSLAVDTACSSSLVTVHLACQSLRQGECSVALAGGVNLVLDPSVTETLVRMQALSPNGRCSAFDARANGFVRGEGCGLVVLKRLSDALAQGDTVLAVIRGSAVNQDGRSQGLTAPNGLAQQALLRQALASAKLEPSALGYVEAHGTGTPLGDPIEVEALRDVLGAPRPDGSRCALGSVKTNLGHLEAAAGIAGLMKAVLALQHEAIPKHLNFTRLNPRIRLEDTPFFIPTALQPWKRSAVPRFAGVSAFGMSGTNAHIILEEAPLAAAPARASVPRASHLLTLSARSEEALEALARRHAEHLTAHPELEAADVCFTANTTRARMPHRLAVVGGSPQALATGLSALVSGEKPRPGDKSPPTARGKAPESAPKIAFLFTGQGAQFAGMGRRLHETSEVFRDALERCAARLRPRMDLLSVMFPQEGAPSRLDQTAYSQPALFALEYALAEQWKAWGVVPDAVMGHSVGEFAAACVAGILSMEDALELIAERGRLMQALPPGGVMASVFATPEQVAPLLAPHAERVSIAAYNAPGQLTLSGAAESLAQLTAALEAQGLSTQRLNVSHAFHSPLLEPMLGALEARAVGMVRSPGRIPLISNVTGQPIGANELGAPGYWRRHAREAVRFQAGMESLRGLGIDTFVEVGPHTTLIGLGRACLGEAPGWFSSLRKGRDDLEQMLGVLGGLFVRGLPLDWRRVDPEPQRRRLVLPRYPWQRQRYWALPESASASTPVSPPEALPAPRELYDLRWLPAVRSVSASPGHGTWLVLGDRGGVGHALAAHLEAQRVPVVWVPPEERGALERLWHERFSASRPCAGVVFLGGLDISGVEGPGVREACAAVASVLRLLEDVSEPGGRLWLVTRGALAVGPEDTRVEPAQAPLWGLGRTVALESPAQWGGLIDLGPDEGVERLWEELRAAEGEDQVALRAGQRYVARLVEREAPEARALSVEAAATYLITGGQGALGLEVARLLVRRGARHLVLTARGTFPERSQWDVLQAQGGELSERIALVRELEAAGAEVRMAKADVERRDAMVALLEQIRAELPPLRGVVHAAAVSVSARVRDLDGEMLGRVLAPKVEGAWNLHTLTRADPLDFFVLFSSVSAVWGSAKGGAYAAANAFLDALAAHRQTQGLTVSSIDWGLWSGRGVATAEERRWLESVGMDALERETALEWLERLVGARVPQAVVARVRWERLRPMFEARGARPLLERLRPEPSPASPEVSRAPDAAPWRESLSALHALVRETVSRTLGLRPDQPLEPERGFQELGLDSIMAVELKDHLQRTLGVPLPATLAFNFPNVRALTEHLATLVKVGAPRDGARAPEGETASEEPIAIVGMACRLPGGVDSPEAFWRLLSEGTEAITDIPPERWDVNGWYDANPETPGRMYARAGGFLRDVEGFEPQFFGISPREAESMDPQQRLVLEVAWEALERSGQDVRALRGTPTGVFVGITTADYARVILQGPVEDVDAWFASGTSLNVVAGRLSYTLGLQGPSMAVDTACSSSLTALHLACQSLRSGESTRALAAGVNVILSPEPMVAVSKARMLSPDGRCKTFDASANGFARAEGCGVLVLERLSDARARGAPILAVIRGTAVNQDGASSGLTVPNGQAQQAVIRQALRRAGVAPTEVSYLEAHGTGTSLGDPIEAEAMWSVLGEGRRGGESLWMGSVKTNLGHLESAAGVAGVMKTVLALQHRQLPAHLHLKTPNPHIDWKGMGVKVPTELTAWEPTQGRRLAGVSAFGFSGTNAHAVLEEAPVAAARTREVERPEHVLVLSARSAQALRALAGRYAQALESGPSLADVCFTAATGRVHFEHRLAIVGADAARVRERLLEVEAGGTPEDVLTGRVAGQSPGVVFVFGGEGALPLASSRTLYETQPVFREALERCEEALKGVLVQPLSRVLYGTGAASTLEESSARAAVFSVEWALARLWRAWGVVPRELLGRGVGALVVEVERGSLGLEEALRRAVSAPPVQGPEDAHERASTEAERVVLSPAETEWPRLLRTLGRLHVRGVEVDWSAFDAPYARGPVVLPTYPFQRQRYWWRGSEARGVLSPREKPSPHFGRRLRSPALEALVYETVYEPSRPAHLNDHRLFGTLVAAGSSHVALVLSVVEDAHGSPACTLENLAFPQALVLAEHEERTVQVLVSPPERGGAFEVKSLGSVQDPERWVTHASGTLRVGPSEPPAAWASREALQARCQQVHPGDVLYRSMHEQGYTLGSGYQWIHSVARDGNELFGELRLPPLPDRAEDHVLHPGLVDSCFQVLASWTLELQARSKDALLIPFSISRFTVHRRPTGALWCHARIETGRSGAEAPLGGDLRIFDERGLVAEVIGFRGRMASREAIRPGAEARREESLYTIHWTPEAEPPAREPPRADTRPWVLWMDARGGGERLGQLLEEHGATVLRVRPGSAFRKLGAGAFEVDARRPEDFTRLMTEALGPEGASGLVYLWGLDQRATNDASAESMQRAALEASGGVLHLVKALVGREWRAPVWLVTRGAQAVREPHPTLALAQSSLWGLGRVLEHELAGLSCARVDLDPEDLEGSVRLLLAELGRGVGPEGREVAFRGGVRLRPVLREDTGSRGRAPALRADASYLITGGLGGLGLEVAKWMVARGAGHLVLVGRREPSARAAEAVRALEEAGARVLVASVDVSREVEVTRLLRRLETSAPPLRGIVHAAGVLDDGALVQQDLTRFERVLAPKVAGAWNLHRLTLDRPLDFFVLFSSASAVLGPAGQGNYAAANAFLDALAHERRARGRVAQALDWGPWAETGMAGAADGALARTLVRRGIRPMPTKRALELFDEALAGGRPQVAPLSIQWPVYLESLGDAGRSSLYEALVSPRSPSTPPAPPPVRSALVERLRAALPHERSHLLTQGLQEEVARILRIDPKEIDWRRGFTELGMDSLMAIELRDALQRALGVSVPATVALDHPTIGFLVQHLLTAVLKLDESAMPPPPPTESLDALSDAELARLVAEDLARES